MSKKILVFYLFWIFLININFIIAYHPTTTIRTGQFQSGGFGISPITWFIIIIGVIIVGTIIYYIIKGDK